MSEEIVVESWGARLGKSLKNVVVGLALFLLAFPLLFWNEGRTIKTTRALEEGQGQTISVKSDKVDAANEGKLIHTTGFADTKDVLTDPTFNVSVTGIRLARTVEMYQWQETRHSETKKKAGGGTETRITYSYEKRWCSSHQDSSEFHDAGYDNPPSFPYQAETFYANDVKLGAYKLNENQIRRIGRAQPLVMTEEMGMPNLKNAVKTDNGFYLVATNAVPALSSDKQILIPSEANIGDIRVTYKLTSPHDVSVVAVQMGDSFVKYVAKNGYTVDLLGDGVKSTEEMYADAHSGNMMTAWLLRLLGFIMMFIGVGMILKPLSVLGDVLPFLGDLIGMGTSLVAFLVALPCTLVTIAVAWFFYRPVLSIVLLGVSGALVVYIMKKRKAKKATVLSNV